MSREEGNVATWLRNMPQFAQNRTNFEFILNNSNELKKYLRLLN